MLNVACLHAAEPAVVQDAKIDVTVPTMSKELLEFLIEFEHLSDEQFDMLSTYAKQDAERAQTEVSNEKSIETDFEGKTDE